MILVLYYISIFIYTDYLLSITQETPICANQIKPAIIPPQNQQLTKVNFQIYILIMLLTIQNIS